MIRSAKSTMMISAAAIAASWLGGWLGLGALWSNGWMIAAAAAGGLPVAVRALQALRYRTFSIELLITVAVTGALAIGEYWEAAAVTFLFTLGAFLEARTLAKTRASLQSLLEQAPAEAAVLRDGAEVRVPAGEVMAGEHVIVRPGERIPVDGIVVKGRASVNQASFTGEPLPAAMEENDEVLGGTIVESGYLELIAVRVGEDTRFAKIIAYVEEAQEAKSKTQRFIERFARWYTPGIMLLSLAVYIVTQDLLLGLTLIVIACPGALVISAPVSAVAGIGHAARRGILLKGGRQLETASRVDIVALDKTGTLTEGKPRVAAVTAFGVSEEQVLRLAALAERRSEHHLARAVLEEAARRGVAPDEAGGNTEEGEYEIVPGRGIIASLAGGVVIVGNFALMTEHQAAVPASVKEAVAMHFWQGRTVIYVGVNGQVIGLIAVSDRLRADARAFVADLHEMGIRTVLLTGDHERSARAAAQEAGIPDYYAGLLPEDKVRMIRGYQAQGLRVAMVGDGVNDAPSLAAADLGAALGDTGTEVAMETADLVIVSGRLERLAEVFRLSRMVVRNMKQNITFAVSVVALLLAGVLAGTVFMASGMLIHELSVIAVVLNALRIAGHGRKRKKEAILPARGLPQCGVCAPHRGR